MTRKHRRLAILGVCALGLGSATALTLTAFSSSLVFFMVPSDLLAKHPSPLQMIRLGGLVKEGSVKREVEGGVPETQFAVTDMKSTVEVSYKGALPDLFREGQGVVAMGHLEKSGTFVATEVLAKHDENYMPKYVEDALKRSGRWNPATGAPPPPASTWDDMRVTKAGS